MDPFSAVADIIVAWHKAGQLQGWLRLLFSITFSYGLGFSTACGTALVATDSWTIGIGSGFLMGAAMALVAYQAANKDITKGTVIAVPQKTVEDRFTSDGRGPMTTQPPK